MSEPDKWGPSRIKFATVQTMLGMKGIEVDGLPGPKSKGIFEALETSVRAELKGGVIITPGWPFAVNVVGDDLVIYGTNATWFGGDNDPDDNGETASGVRTKGNPQCIGCALPVLHFHKSTADSPLAFNRGAMLPGIPWHTAVEVTWGGRSVIAPLIDNGPAKSVQQTIRGGKAIDLTPEAMAILSGQGKRPNGNPVAGSLGPLTVRIVGGAQYARATV